MKQIKMSLNKGKHGGRRQGSGRKRIRSKGVSHDKFLLTKGMRSLTVTFAKGLHGLRLIRKFSRKRRITLKLGKKGEWKLDESTSFLMKRTITQLI